MMLKPTHIKRPASSQKKTRKNGETPRHRIHSLATSRNKYGAYSELKLCVSTLNGFEVVDLKNILYCEANESYAIIHLTSGSKICASRSLNTFEQLLQNYAFMRVHKSFLINLHHIKHYIKGQGGTVTLSNGTEVEVSRRKKNEFITAVKALLIM